MSPHRYNDAETLSSLRFGARARNIQNQPKVNKEHSVPELVKMLNQAENRNTLLENKIKALTLKIQGAEKEFDQENMSPKNMNKPLFEDTENKMIKLKPFTTSRLTELSMIT